MPGLLDGVPKREGALFGVVTYGAGAFVSFPMLLVAGGELADQALTLPVAMAVFFYALQHAWPILFGLTPEFLVYAPVPAVLLVAAGFALARRTTDWSARAPIRGASVAFGYLTAAGVSLFFAGVRFQLHFADATSGQAIAEVLDPVFLAVSIAYTGLIFPLLFGGLGGYLAERRGY